MMRLRENAENTIVPTKRATHGSQILNLSIDGSKRNEGEQRQRHSANRVVNKFCMNMMPALNDDPVNAHLLTRSIEIELTLKKTAEHVNTVRLTSSGGATVGGATVCM